jgi:hypothetical protein
MGWNRERGGEDSGAGQRGKASPELEGSWPAAEVEETRGGRRRCEGVRSWGVVLLCFDLPRGLEVLAIAWRLGPILDFFGA